MEGFIEIALGFPTVIYSFFLTFVLIYWLFVIVGALDLDLLDSGIEAIGESVGDAALEGLAEGSAEGAAEAGAEAGAEGALQGALSLLGALGLRRVPVTIALSLIILFAWLSAYFLSRAARDLPGEGLIGVAIALGVFALASVAGTLCAALAVRPLAGAFDFHTQSAGALVVGQTVTIKSTQVTERMGQGELDDGGAGLLLNLRCNIANGLRKGSHALIVAYDPVGDLYEVAPLGDEGGAQQTESQRRAAAPQREHAQS